MNQKIEEAAGKITSLMKQRDEIVIEIREIKRYLVEEVVRSGNLDLLEVKLDRLIPPHRYR